MSTDSDTKNITLYAILGSPWSHRVRIALDEGNIPHDIIWIDLANKPDWYEKNVNPYTGKLPFLVYGGPKLKPGDTPSPELAQVYESIVIMEFLADTFPAAGLLPASPALKAKARIFYQAVDTVLHPAFMAFFFKNGPLDPMLSAWEYLQRLLPTSSEDGADDASGTLVLGKQWSIADAALLPYWLIASISMELAPGTRGKEALEAMRSEKFAKLQRHLQTVHARESNTKTWDEAFVRTATAARMQSMVVPSVEESGQNPTK